MIEPATAAAASGSADTEHGLELSIVMPCLNEAETIAICVQKAVSFLLLNGVDGEVVIADNGSTDGSRALAEAAGARVIAIPERGYGSALIGGIRAASLEKREGWEVCGYHFSSLSAPTLILKRRLGD